MTDRATILAAVAMVFERDATELEYSFLASDRILDEAARLKRVGDEVFEAAVDACEDPDSDPWVAANDWLGGAR